MKEKTPRKKQAEKSKQRIYETAISIFSEKGFDDTSISEICKKANCSVGAFYHYFPSKDSILEENLRIADEKFSGWKKLIKEKLHGRELIIAYMKAYAKLVSRESGLEFAKRFYNGNNKMFIRKGRPMQTRLTEIINGAIEAGEVSLELSAEESCEWLFVGARGIVLNWCLHEGEFDLVDEMGIYARRALKGITVERG
jgi:AcrR family transcriptional regulator